MDLRFKLNTALICIYRDVVTSRCRTKWPILSPAARHSSEFYRGTAAITADSVKNNEFLPVILIEGEPRNRQQELSSSESVKYFLIDHTNWWWLPGPGLGTIRLPLQRSYSAEGGCAQQTCEQCMTMLYNYACLWNLQSQVDLFVDKSFHHWRSLHRVRQLDWMSQLPVWLGLNIF